MHRCCFALQLLVLLMVVLLCFAMDLVFLLAEEMGVSITRRLSATMRSHRAHAQDEHQAVAARLGRFYKNIF